MYFPNDFRDRALGGAGVFIPLSVVNRTKTEALPLTDMLLDDVQGTSQALVTPRLAAETIEKLSSFPNLVIHIPFSS